MQVFKLLRHSNTCIALVQYYWDYVETTFRYCTLILLRLSILKDFQILYLNNYHLICGYVEAAFRYCTYGTFEIVHVKTTFLLHMQCYQDYLCPDSIQLLHFQSYGEYYWQMQCLIRHHMYFKCLMKYVCNIFHFSFLWFLK